MSGLDYLKRHIKRLPEPQMRAMMNLINGEPYDKWEAKEGARQLWAWNVVPATGMVE